MVNYESDNDDIQYIPRKDQFLLLRILAWMLSERYKSHRRFGIGILGNVPWGAHFYLFYETEQELIDILISFFRAGLESNEFCMWITSEPLNEEKARSALREAIPDFNRHLRIGQMEIISYNPRYFKNGIFDLQKVMNGWIGKIDQITSAGFNGTRWLGGRDLPTEKKWRNISCTSVTFNSRR